MSEPGKKIILFIMLILSKFMCLNNYELSTEITEPVAVYNFISYCTRLDNGSLKGLISNVFSE